MNRFFGLLCTYDLEFHGGRATVEAPMLDGPFSVVSTPMRCLHTRGFGNRTTGLPRIHLRRCARQTRELRERPYSTVYQLNPPAPMPSTASARLATPTWTVGRVFAEISGATPQGRQFHAKGEAEARAGNLAGAIQHLRMALTFEPANTGFQTQIDAWKRDEQTSA